MTVLELCLKLMGYLKVDKIHDSKDWQYDARKCIEELNELATELIKQYNKPHKDYHTKIQDELADVIYRTDKMVIYYSQEAIERRINNKWGLTSDDNVV